MRLLRNASLALLAASTAACSLWYGDGAPPPRRPAPKPVATVAPPPPASDEVAVDPLGPRPPVPPVAPYAPPVPVVYQRAGGLTVWLVERHALPIVAMDLVVPAGSASDPEGKGGLALMTANMLDEGAGGRGALDLSRDLDKLGAALQTGAVTDYAFASLTVLKKNLAPAAALFGDVVVRPTLSPVEWKRVHDLWLNDLKARASEPDAVASVVAQRQVFGDSPYGHPTNGTTRSAAKVSLEDVKAFYAQAWRPYRATLVVVGDVTKAELEPMLDKVLGAWKAPAGAPPPVAQAGKKAPTPARRVVIVDRADAPQSVIAVVRPGLAASDADAAPVTRVNTALGGSFTSRLNQDLREEHGWSYGAHSRFSFAKAQGLFAAQAAVHTEHTGEALRAMLADIDALTKEGLSDEEIEKTRLIARADLVEAFEGSAGTARRLARNAGVGLPADHEARASLATGAATKEDLRRLAAKYLDPKDAVVVIVGPRAQLQPQLEAIGITSLVASGPEGE
ncbi:MAG: zinc protease [Labilithrix sp.]|nr:zinc protease [Labilithrix sp.]